MSLIEKVDNCFWKFEDANLNEFDKKYFLQTHWRMKTLVRIIVWSTFGCIIVYYFPSVFTVGDLPFDAYQPPWMTKKQILMLQIFVVSVYVVPTMSAAVIFLMTFCILTQLQFRLLIRKLKQILKMEKDLPRIQIKNIVDQHNFLLQ